MLSGVLCLSRVWDGNSRSIRDLVDSLSYDFVEIALVDGFRERVDFFRIFDQYDEWLGAEIVGRTNEQLLSGTIKSINFMKEQTIEMGTVGKLIDYRNWVLAHSTGKKLSHERSLLLADCEELLVASMRIYERVLWLTENDHIDFCIEHANYKSEAESDWQEMFGRNE